MPLAQRFARALIVLCVALAASIDAHAAESRLSLADQSDFGTKTGFYLGFENSAPGDASPKLSTLKLILAVGDGSSWRFLSAQPALEYGREYTVVGTIGESESRLDMDGKPLMVQQATLRPLATTLVTNNVPGWASAPADYLIYPRSIAVTGGNQVVSVDFGPPAPLPVRLMGGGDARRFDGWRVAPGKPVTIRAVFRLDERPTDMHTLAPFIDAYGQARYATWPGKTTTDSDLKSAARQEAEILKKWTPDPGYDPFGGATNAGWHAPATGYFAVTRHGARWWLLSPRGNPTFYTSLDTAPALAWDCTPVTGREFLFASIPPRDGATKAAWCENPWGSDPGAAFVSFHSVNMLKKFGPDWQAVERKLTARRLRSWSFSGLGKWSEMLPGIVSMPVLNTSGVPKIARHPDIFDPVVQESLRSSLRSQIAPHLKDPYVLGWSVGNEYDEIVTPDEVKEILKKESVPAKRALVDCAVDTLYRGDVAQAAAAAGVPTADRNALYAAPIKLPDSAIETLRRFYANRYYGFLYHTIKQIDPNHLYLGFWIAFGWWVNEEDWQLIARNCDVIGYDRYTFTFHDPEFDRVVKKAGKPTLCGEYSFPPAYHGQRGFGSYPSSTADEQESATRYAAWTRAAATDPYCVGLGWFQYRDEPLTGRGPGHDAELVLGEHYAFGFVDETDKPKWTLVTAARKANLAATKERLGK